MRTIAVISRVNSANDCHYTAKAGAHSLSGHSRQRALCHVVFVSSFLALRLDCKRCGLRALRVRVRAALSSSIKSVLTGWVKSSLALTTGSLVRLVHNPLC